MEEDVLENFLSVKLEETKWDGTCIQMNNRHIQSLQRELQCSGYVTVMQLAEINGYILYLCKLLECLVQLTN